MANEALIEAWRRLPLSDAPIGRQLALSEGLLSGLADVAIPALRWYITSRPELVLGNGQKPEVADGAACHACGVAAYRRTSGGTAVLVDGDALSMEVAVPAGHPLAGSDIVRAYRWIGEVWEQALRSLGIDQARVIPTEEVRALPPLPKDDPLRLACYGTLSPWEVVAGQRKVVGLCQVRRRPGVLYQIGVYRRWRPEMLTVLLALSETERERLSVRLREAAAGLDELAQREVSTAEIIAAVEATLTARMNVRLTQGDWRPDELAAADRIEHDRFQPIA